MKCCESLREKCQAETPLEGKEVKNIIVLTFAFQVVFTAFNALQNMHSSLHDEQSLGNFCLAILYGTAILSSVLSPIIIGLIGAKTVLVISFAGHCVYVLANFYPSFATMAPAAVVLGAFLGPAWTSQALYISASAYSFSKSSASSPYSILSRFNGIFFAVFATTQIVGNLVTSTVIRDGVGNRTDDNLVIFKFCGPDDCPDNENATQIEDPDDWVIDITLGFFMGCTLLGLTLIIVLLSPLPRSDWIQRVSLRHTATSCFNVLVSSNMILLTPFMLFTAVEHAILLSVFTKAYVSCPIGIHMVGYVMAAYGATTPVFLFIFSRLVRVTGRFLLLMFSQITHIVLLIILFLWSPTKDEEAFIFLVPMVWGVAESILQAQANSLIALLYPSQKEPAFANFHAWRSLGYTVSFLNATYLCVSTKLILAIICAGLGTVLYVFVEIRTKMKEKLALKSSPVEALPPEEMAEEETRAESIVSNRSSVASFQSIQDRLSFDHVELAEIIQEAQSGWKRDEDGLTLEINKVMSSEHLQNCKVTNWYRTIPVPADFANVAIAGLSNGHAGGLPRSLSDGHLYSSTKRKGRTSVKMHRFISQPNGHVHRSRRPLSDTEHRNFDSIPEVESEDAEYNMVENGSFPNAIQTGPNGTVLPEDGQSDNHNPSDKADDRAQHIAFIRRLSESFQGFKLKESQTKKPELTLSIPSQTSLSSSHGKNSSGSSVADEPLSSNGRTVKFSIGPKSPERSVSFNANGSKSPRPLSLESNGDSEGSIVILKTTPNGDGGTSPPKPSKKGRGFFRFGKKKDWEVRVNMSFEIPSTNNLNNSGEEVDSGEDNLSEADSDGFVDEENDEFDEADVGMPLSFMDYERIRRKSLMPVCESEDVTCIY